MVKINQLCMHITHRLYANKDIGNLKLGDWIDCLIQKMSDGRFAVMSQSFATSFYVVFESEDQMHDTFTEQHTLALG